MVKIKEYNNVFSDSRKYSSSVHFNLLIQQKQSVFDFSSDSEPDFFHSLSTSELYKVPSKIKEEVNKFF